MEIFFALNELGNAQRMEAAFGDRFIWTKTTDWMVYRGGVWQRDERKDSVKAMTIIIEAMANSDDEAERKWAFSAGCNSHINGSLSVATSLKVFSRGYSEFNRRIDLFNCSNGTYNLATGEFLPHDAKDMLTKSSRVKYDTGATCPRFEKFLSEVMAGKESLRLFLQRACGYTISASTAEPVVLIPYGTGGTGKSTFLTILRGIMGGYASVADSEMLMSKRGDVGQPFEMAGMEGSRALFASEVEEGRRLAMAKVKQMTGGDPVKACYKGKEAYEFVPQWKIWLACNDVPTVAADDEAIWDRLKLIPFDVKFRGAANQVKDLAHVLLAEEASGILNWFIAGYANWREQGLNYPQEVQAATEEWREEEDYLARYLADHTETTEDSTMWVSKSDLFAHFSTWAKENKEGRWMTNKQFTQQMEKKGFSDGYHKPHGKSVRCWKALRLSAPLERFTKSVRESNDHENTLDDFLFPEEVAVKPLN